MKIDIKITDDGGRIHHKQFTINNKKSHTSIQQNKDVKPIRKKPTTSSLILELITDGYLNDYRTTTDLISEFKKRSYKFRSYDLSQPLIDLVRQKKIRRKENIKKNPKWLYKKC